MLPRANPPQASPPAAAVPPQLAMRRGSKAGHVFTLGLPRIAIGSGRNNGIVLQDDDISTEHCLLTQTPDGGYILSDLGFRLPEADRKKHAGTFVNGQPAGRGWPLAHGALIEMGTGVTFAYLHPRPATAPLRTPDQQQPCLALNVPGAPPDLYVLRSPTVRLGRALVNNDIVLPDVDVSRYHAQLVWDATAQGYVVEDLNSRNGTFVNGTLVLDRQPLRYGDTLRLGSASALRYLPQSALLYEQHTAARSAEEAAAEPTDSDTHGRPPKAAAATVDEVPAPGALEDALLLAYAPPDWERVAAPLLIGLQDANFHVWTSQHLSYGSESWKAANTQALQECWALVLVMSDAALSTPHVVEAARYFFNREKPMLLVGVGDDPRTTTVFRGGTHVAYDPDEPGSAARRLVVELMKLR